MKRDGETKYHFDLGKLVKKKKYIYIYPFKFLLFFFFKKNKKNEKLKKKNLECFVACKTNIAFNKYWARFGIGE